MQFKEIDSKIKEIYYTPILLKEKEEDLTFQNNFWNSMNMIAFQNMKNIQQLKTA